MTAQGMVSGNDSAITKKNCVQEKITGTDGNTASLYDAKKSQLEVLFNF